MTDGPRPIPRATYRLQLNKDFTFRHVEAIAPYLGKLGISHAYLSPILEARPGSTHGYDTVDHRQLNPELGTLDEFRQMARSLRTAGVSIILDIVPNHMGIGGDRNDLWLDVLEWGKASRYAEWFDINWDPIEPTLKNKVLVPFLGRAYGEALRDGGLELRFENNTGSFAVWAETAHKLPIRPVDYAYILDSGSTALASIRDGFASVSSREDFAAAKASLATASADHAAIDAAVARINGEPGRGRLATLIECQNWRPARYSVAADDINYRRFFIVSDLAAIRIERDDVFDHVHALTFQLVEEGWVEGLRVDHIDGLYDPEAYCLKLRRLCPRPIYLLVEKILAPGELLRSNWDVEGTTGYEFAGAVNRLLTDPAGEGPLTETYRTFTGRTETLGEIERGAKLDIIDFEMSAELDALAARLRVLAASHQSTADLTRNALRAALRATIAELQVYRTYVATGDIGDDYRRTITEAISLARKATPALDPAVFAFLADVMTATSDPALDIAMRIQQYTGPVMAKGLEDTALYRFNRLISLSDVGEKPDQFTQSVASFHAFMISRLTEQPNGLLGTSTHDTKRGEDARARIAAISGHAGRWAESVAEWRAQLARQGASEIEANDAYHFFQLLLGAWPAKVGDGAIVPPESLASFRERQQGAMRKSVREARVRTNWNASNPDYERSLAAYVDVALAPDSAFLAAFLRFEAMIAFDGASNGLIETVLKLTLPGVPDIYQGAELWEQSMVDPDNRRPVDFALRETLLDSSAGADLRALSKDFRTGAVKLALIARLLKFRAQHPDLFTKGSYEPIEIEGPDSDRVLAFERKQNGVTLLVIVALGPWHGPVSASLNASLADSWTDVLASHRLTLSSSIADLLGEFPFTVLTTTHTPH